MQTARDYQDRTLEEPASLPKAQSYRSYSFNLTNQPDDQTLRPDALQIFISNAGENFPIYSCNPAKPVMFKHRQSFVLNSLVTVTQKLPTFDR